MKIKEAVLSTVLLFPLVASSYEVNTHEEFVDHAFKKSVLSEDEIWENIRIDSDQNLLFLETTEFTDTRLGLNNGQVDRTALAIMRFGATKEDDIPLTNVRPINHFFDPFNDRALTAVPDNPLTSEPPTYRSPDWSLDQPSPISDQEYSYNDAKERYFGLLTATSQNDRELLAGQLFRTLGQVLHHIGDMAQPDHVRDDAHLVVPIATSVFGLGDPSFYEFYTQLVTEGDFSDEENFPDRSLQPRFLSTFDGYDSVVLAKPRDYWHTEGKGQYDGVGLAEFTNREFVSKDTNFGTLNSIEFPRPNRSEDLNSDGSEPKFQQDASVAFSAFGLSAPRICTAALGSCVMKFRSMEIEDNLRPSAGGRNVYAVTESIFNTEINGLNPSGNLNPQFEEIYTVNKINFWSGYPFLTSRVSGYTSGLINHFFRGKLEVSAPSNGIVGIIDHSNAMNAEDGFEKIKLNVENVTKDIEVEGPNGGAISQDAGEGILVATARFKKNLCYQGDLSGEIQGFSRENSDLEAFTDGPRPFDIRSTPDSQGNQKVFFFQKWRPKFTINETATRAFVTANGDSLGSCIAPSETAVVSKEIQVSAGEFDQLGGKEYVFDFSSSPIPISASFDLDVVVTFKGKVGQEENMVAVGRRDISEPTYFSVLNSSDFFQDKNQIVNPSAFMPDEDDPILRAYVSTEPMTNVSISLGGEKIARLDSLGPQSFARIATLLDLGDDPSPFNSSSLREYEFTTDFTFQGGQGINNATGFLGIPNLNRLNGSYCGPEFNTGTLCNFADRPISMPGTINGTYGFQDIEAFTFRPYYKFRGWFYPDPLFAPTVSGTRADPRHRGMFLFLRRSVFLKDSYGLFDGLHPIYNGLNVYPPDAPVVPGFFFDDIGVMPDILNATNPSPFNSIMSLE